MEGPASQPREKYMEMLNDDEEDRMWLKFVTESGTELTYQVNINATFGAMMRQYADEVVSGQ